MANYLRLRDQYYYLRIRVPADLLGLIPSPEILKALHTKDPKTACLCASAMRPKFLQVFTLIRAGFITQEQARESVSRLLERKAKAVATTDTPTIETPAGSPLSIPPLSQIITQYVTDNKTAWTGKTHLEYSSYFRLLQDVLGVESMAAIDREAVRKLRDNLSRLPANLYKKHPGKTVKEVLAMDSITPMSTTTVNKLLTLFGGIMRHCIKEGYRKDNPTEGLKIKQNRRTDEERKAYTKEDLVKIVSSLPSPTDKPERYWIPLIGMYSGLRLGEVCGLHLEDVKQVDGVWVFDVNEEGDRRLKNLSSNRLVPIHPQLIEKGLLELVDTLRGKESVRLWPNLVRREIDGYCHALGNWYGRFNRKHVTDDPLKTFHSLRHSFADTLKQQGEQENLISELMGHTNNSITTGRYGKRYRVESLLTVVSRIDYGINIRTLAFVLMGPMLTNLRG